MAPRSFPWTRRACGALLAFAAAASLVRAAPPPQGEKPEEFSHKYHVQEQWSKEPEVWRDCRGCHVYAREQSREPEASCARCHYAAFELPLQVETPGAAGRAPAVEGFEHEEHASLACHVCHHESNLEGGKVRFVPTQMKVPVGFELCAKCHGSESRYSDIARRTPNQLLHIPGPEEGWESRFFEAMNSDPAMGPGAVEPFRHDEHMLDVEAKPSLARFLAPGGDPRAAENACGSCHRSVARASTAALGNDTFEATDCGRCHQGPDGGALAFATGLVERPSPSARTFVHADHLRGTWEGTPGVVPSARQAIETEACFACHAYSDDDRTYRLDPSKATYEGCVTCHAEPPWTLAGTRAPTPERNWWHGEWTSCRQCHSFEGPERKTDRPRVAVARRRPTTFTITTQTHPGIAADTRVEDCTRCHKAPVQELPSRTVRSRFQHSTHVPPLTPENRAQVLETCTECHGSRLSHAANSRELGFLAGDAANRALDGLTYDPAACSRCHRGGDPEPDAFEPDDSEVADFSHRAHLSAPSHQPPLDCVTCHLGPGPSPTIPAGDVGVQPTAADCTLCHAHDEGEKAAFTGRVTQADLASCLPCHIEGLPAPGAALRAQRMSLLDPPALLGSQGQAHPEDRTCAQCHVEDPSDSLMSPKKEARIAAVHGSPHANTEKQGECGDCHWALGVPTMDPEQMDRGRFGKQETNSRGDPFPGQVSPPK